MSYALGLRLEIRLGQDLNAWLPEQQLTSALGFNLAPGPQLERGPGCSKPVEAFLRPFLGQLSHMPGEVVAGGLDANDAALGIERQNVDYAEQVLADTVGSAVRVPLLDDGADETLFT